MSFLEVHDLHKSYPSGSTLLHVLRGLSLELKRGDLLAILGSSGSGKSTFLHLVGAMEKPDSGSIRYDGVELVGLEATRLAQFRNEKIGFIFQFHHLLPEFSALENVMIPLLIRREPTEVCRSVAEALLAEVELKERVAHKPGEMSGGEQQRVAIARALAGNPEIILADEPTGNLDARTAQSVHALLEELHRKRKFTAIVVTHNPALADLCHKRKIMQDGKLVDSA
ncbi:MAG TPA: ABC transporter ATP-binding protein [Acidobacteriota bacterium]|jgi:lipoprotein-releasing system ATP-binding protein|nr:ABC transporter ATP-binding protein [Acidobacteriota bacterium]